MLNVKESIIKLEEVTQPSNSMECSYLSSTLNMLW